MDINKAVIHTLDADLKTVVLSEIPLNLNNAPDLEGYLEKMVRGFTKSVSVSRAKVGTQSMLHPLIQTQFNFIETSQAIARQWFADNVRTMAYDAKNMLIALVDVDDAVHMMMLEMGSKQGFIKITQNQNGLENCIVPNRAILPNTFVSASAGFLMNLSTGDIVIKHQGDTLDRLETLADCTLIANTKTTFQVVDSLVHYISEKREEPALTNTIKAKQVVNDSIEFYDGIEPQQILTEVFSVLDDTETQVMTSSFEANNVSEMIDLKQVKRTSLTKKHRIRTESGIEIILPLDILDVQDIIDIQTDINGRVSIALKDIGKIIE